MKGFRISSIGGTLENLSIKCWTLAGETIESDSEAAQAHVVFQNVPPATYLPCGDSTSSRASLTRSTPAPPQRFANSRLVRVSGPGKHRLLVMSLDGRVVAMKQGTGSAVYDVGAMVGRVPGVYLLRLFHDGAVESKALAAY